MTDNVATTQGNITLNSSELRSFKCQPEANACDRTGGKRGILVRMSQPSRHAVCLGPPESFPVVPQAHPSKAERGRKTALGGREGGMEGSKLLFPFNASWHVASPILRPVSSALTPPIKILQPQSPSADRQTDRTAHVRLSVCLPDSWISIRDEGGMHEEVEGTDGQGREGAAAGPIFASTQFRHVSLRCSKFAFCPSSREITTCMRAFRVLPARKRDPNCLLKLSSRRPRYRIRRCAFVVPLPRTVWSSKLKWDLTLEMGGRSNIRIKDTFLENVSYLELEIRKLF